MSTEPPKTLADKIAAAARALRHHDWHYERSDDPRYFRRGKSQAVEIDSLLIALPIDVANGLWAGLAPPDFPRPWKTPPESSPPVKPDLPFID